MTFVGYEIIFNLKVFVLNTTCRSSVELKTFVAFSSIYLTSSHFNLSFALQVLFLLFLIPPKKFNEAFVAFSRI